MTRASKVIDIIGEGFNLPKDISLNELLAYVYLADESGEIIKLLVKAGTKDIIEKIQKETTQ